MTLSIVNAVIYDCSRGSSFLIVNSLFLTLLCVLLRQEKRYLIIMTYFYKKCKELKGSSIKYVRFGGGEGQPSVVKAYWGGGGGWLDCDVTLFLALNNNLIELSDWKCFKILKITKIVLFWAIIRINFRPPGNGILMIYDYICKNCFKWLDSL